jgi:hypothetical protein
LLGDLATRLGTPATLFDTAADQWLVAELLAHVGAVVASIRAETAGVVSKLRATKHEVRAELTCLSALKQSPDVDRGGMILAVVEAMGEGRNADVVTRRAPRDARLQLVREVIGGGVAHERAFCSGPPPSKSSREGGPEQVEPA